LPSGLPTSQLVISVLNENNGYLGKAKCHVEILGNIYTYVCVF